MRSKLFVGATALAVAWFFVPSHMGAAELGGADEDGEAIETPGFEFTPASEVEPDGLADATEAELMDALQGAELPPLESLAVPALPTDSADFAPSVSLGAIGYDAEGNEGRVHIVISGDTLWDISAAYLGSAWVWPSIWQDNDDIENPHLIIPGDHIWITNTEMRKLTRAEAEQLLAGRPVQPAELEESMTPAAPPAPAPVYEAPAPRPTVQIARWESADLISSEQLESSSSVVDAVADRLMISQGDDVYIGLGANDVAAGDQFTIFRMREEVLDPDTQEPLGFHVDVLGWVDVLETHSETSIAKVRRSDGDITRGDRLMPRQPPLLEVTVQDSPQGVTGKLSFFADSRTMTSQVDFVYLNRGLRDGLVVGSPLEVYRESYQAMETARNELVTVPPRAVASLIVVRANARSSVAFVRSSGVELEIGDHFRAAEQLQSVASR